MNLYKCFARGLQGFHHKIGRRFRGFCKSDQKVQKMGSKKNLVLTGSKGQKVVWDVCKRRLQGFHEVQRGFGMLQKVLRGSWKQILEVSKKVLKKFQDFVARFGRERRSRFYVGNVDFENLIPKKIYVSSGIFFSETYLILVSFQTIQTLLQKKITGRFCTVMTALLARTPKW